VEIPSHGATVSANTYVNSTVFMQQLKRWGLRTSMSRLCLYTGDDYLAMRTSIIHDVGGTTNAPENFVAGDYTEATGLTGDTTTKQLRFETQPNLSALSVGGTLHFAVYNRTDGTSPGYVIGTADAGSQLTFALLLKYSGDNNTYFQMGASASFVATNEASVLGFYAGSYYNTNDAKLYKNGVLRAAYDPLATGFPPEENPVHAGNSSGTFVRTARTLSYFSLGGALSATQNSSLNTLVQWYQGLYNRRVN